MSGPWDRAGPSPEDRPRPLLRIGGALCGDLAAIASAHLLVSLRSASVDPAVVAASGGTWAFGDFVSEVLVAGPLSIAPTWALLRALRDVEWLWRLAVQLIRARS